MDMKPEVKKINVTQMLITLALVGILGCLLGLYIYYGMNQARQTTPVAEVPVPVVMDPNESRRQEIIAALKNQPAPADSFENRVIINSLKQNQTTNDSEATQLKQQEIIKALQQN